MLSLSRVRLESLVWACCQVSCKFLCSEDIVSKGNNFCSSRETPRSKRSQTALPPPLPPLIMGGRVTYHLLSQGHSARVLGDNKAC